MNNFIELLKYNLKDENGLIYIEAQINLFFKTISTCTNNVEEAELYFKNLEDMQYLLAKHVFKYNLEVSSFLRDFIYDFDRIDDFETKNYLYKRIKKEFGSG